MPINLHCRVCTDQIFGPCAAHRAPQTRRRSSSLSTPLRQPVAELAEYYGVTIEVLTALLRRLHLTPHQGSLSMAQDKKLAAYLETMQQRPSVRQHP